MGCCRWCRRASSNCMSAAPPSTISIAATGSYSTSIPATASGGATSSGGARGARTAGGDRSRMLREAVRRQGRARGAAGGAGRLGNDQDVHAGVRAGDGGRRSEALRRDDDEVDPQRQNLHRLSSQLAGADRGCRLFDAGARRRSRVRARDLGGARPAQIGQPVHAAQSRQAARLAQTR